MILMILMNETIKNLISRKTTKLYGRSLKSVQIAIKFTTKQI